MLAKECPFYSACRFQQGQNEELRAKGGRAVPIWAEKVGCDDQKTDMEKHCCRLANLLTHLAAVKAERALDTPVALDAKRLEPSRQSYRQKATVVAAGFLAVTTIQLAACATKKPVEIVPDRCDEHDCNIGKPPHSRDVNGKPD